MQVPREQLRTSLVAVWLVLSLPLFLSLLLAVAGPPEAIDAVTPTCMWKARLGRDCPGCGLTTSFVMVGSGDWEGAAHAHAAGLPLFAIFAANSILAAAYAVRRLLR